MHICRFVITLFIAIPLFAQTFTNARVNEIEADGRSINAVIATLPRAEAAWLAWIVPTTATSICCWSGGSCCGECSIDGNRNTSTGDGDRVNHLTTEMLLVAQVEQGAVRRISVFDATCKVSGEGQAIHLIRNVTPEASLDYLIAHAGDGDGSRSVFALSLHDHPRTVPELIRLAREHQSSETRKHAIFWLGQKAGVKAAGALRQAVDDDPDEKVRQHAVFAISQLPRERSVPMLVDLVKTHRSASVRKRAMFWLAQSGDQRGLDLMEEILLR
ncbi:MAG TPA: HEAT repeat domain-containing protein [Thermoanaerobaculia bacterium]